MAQRTRGKQLAGMGARNSGLGSESTTLPTIGGARARETRLAGQAACRVCASPAHDPKRLSVAQLLEQSAELS